MDSRPIAIAMLLFLTGAPAWAAPPPIVRSLPANRKASHSDEMRIPTFANGRFVGLKVRGRFAYLIQPTRSPDAKSRWLWICPFEQGLNDAKGHVQQRFYMQKALDAGFAVGGVDVGVSCGSPAGAEVCNEFYRLLLDQYHLNKKARVIGQSNGGLIAYAWAFRHPDCVDRIAGIYPATDVRTWPGLDKLLIYPQKGLGFEMSAGQLSGGLSKLNPIDNLSPLAKERVPILHIHGDKDELVPMEANSVKLMRRYRDLGGKADLIVLHGLKHGGAPFFHSAEFAEFLVAN